MIETHLCGRVTGAAVLLAVLLARSSEAQAIQVEPFVGIASGPAANAGLSVWRMGTEALGFRGSVSWLGPTETQGAGGSIRGGVVAAAPVAGGPVFRPFVAIEFGVAKRTDGDAYPQLRPAIGVILRPGARLGYVVEAGFAFNHNQPDEWSAIAGVTLSR